MTEREARMHARIVAAQIAAQAARFGGMCIPADGDDPAAIHRAMAAQPTHRPDMQSGDDTQ